MPKETPPPLDSFDDTSREFVAALRSDDPDVRAIAIDEVSPVVNDPLARELLRFVRDPERGEQERGRALIALGPALEECSLEEDIEAGLEAAAPDAEDWWEAPLSAVGYRELTEELRRIYHDGSLPKLVRRRALEAGVRAPRDWHREAAATAWRSGDPEWRVTAVFAMGHLQGFGDEIVEAFRSPDPELRREAMRAAGRSETGEVLAEDLLAVAADRSAPRGDRLSAIGAVADLQLPESSAVLSELADDPDREVARAAEAALEELDLWDDLDEVDFEGLDEELDGSGDEEELWR